MSEISIDCDFNSVRYVLAAVRRQLASASIENPLLDAEWIVSHVLGVGRLKLPLLYARELTTVEIERISRLIDRRTSREPLQYVLGNVLFADLDLRVTSSVLIPRPETEEFFERIVAMNECPPDRILDLGTGSGALALGLARAFTGAEVIAVDQSKAALTLAKENAERNGLKGRVRFLLSDWMEQVEGKFDLIVSNPPYLDDDEWLSCDPEIRDFEPTVALVAESGDSAADLMRIVTNAASRLHPGGVLALETGEGHFACLLELASQTGYFNPRGFQDLRGCQRFFFAYWPN